VAEAIDGLVEDKFQQKWPLKAACVQRFQNRSADLGFVAGASGHIYCELPGTIASALFKFLACEKE
jgi:hypothetical protein